MGYIMEGIYFVFSHMGIFDIGLCIIVFTIVIRMFLLPMQVKQQKFSKLNAIMSPEIKAIQDKYKGKKDQETQMKQQAEIKEVYCSVRSIKHIFRQSVTGVRNIAQTCKTIEDIKVCKFIRLTYY